MRSILCILVAVALAISMTACKKKPKAAETSLPENSIVSEESSIAESSIAESAAENETPPSAATVSLPETSSEPEVPLEEKMISGIIQDASMNTIMIKVEDGTMRAFATMDADKNECNGLLVGSRVEIYYTGELGVRNTSDVTVTRLTQSAS